MDELAAAGAAGTTSTQVERVHDGEEPVEGAVDAVSGGRAGYDERPPWWCDGLGVQALSGLYRRVVEAVVADATARP
ncbi:hypothetical protein JK361_36000 [Streptomyces sp. 5-8]|uniref:Uncharacterized protein n=1 Tax=Streptomyces musisoli TaxID=2802280 RepID=A0ABS1PC12_9ACTN|nr:hypothetical protein [Streptomyces musisoli]MBL1109910.1 hypothetical protein [Streptomyces musisoli]